MTLPAAPASANLEITGVEVARVSDWFRYSLFRVGAWFALALVVVAAGLSFTGRDADLLATLAAGAILAAPVTVAVVRSWPAWRLVFRHPAILLLVGPLTVAAGILGDRSAFYYPELLWVAGAAIAGGMRWALACVVVFTLATIGAGTLTGELTGRQAVTEAVLVIGPRVVLAVLMAGLFDGLAHIVWLRAVEVTHAPEMQLSPAAVDAKATPARTIHADWVGQGEEAEEVLDAVVVGVVVAELEPSRSGVPPGSSARTQMTRTPARRRALTDFERAVLEVMADGMTVAQAAQELGISARTARARIERALSRNHLHSTPALIRWALETGHLLPRWAAQPPANQPDRSGRGPSGPGHPGAG